MSTHAELEPGEMLKYLPAIYRGAEGKFLREFLAAFGEILVGRADAQSAPAEEKFSYHYKGDPYHLPSLEAAVADIAKLFDPATTRDEFLPWLAGWAAFSLRRDLPLESQRNFLKRIFKLYQRRGTRENMTELLTIFTVGVPTVTEDEEKAHHFQVELVLLEDKGKKIVDPQAIERQVAIAYALIDLEKPAHTSYELKTVHVSMQLGMRSTIGKDTLLGVVRKNAN